MATRTPARTGKRRKRKLSEKQRRIYRRRRIVVGVVLVLVLALVGFCVYSIGRGAFAVGALVAGHDVGITRKAVPDHTPSTGVRDCVEDSISLELSTTAQTVPVGGSIDFAAGIYLEKKVGDEVAPGEVLARAYSNKEAVKEALEEIEGAYVIASERPPVLPLIREYIEA